MKLFNVHNICRARTNQFLSKQLAIHGTYFSFFVVVVNQQAVIYIYFFFIEAHSVPLT